jgi:hypothetical protein
MTQLAQDIRSCRLAWLALGFAGVSLTLEVRRWLIGNELAWTSVVLSVVIAMNVGPTAVGWTRTRPQLTRVFHIVSLVLGLGVLAVQFGG